mgnify:CR=1 FL=1
MVFYNLATLIEQLVHLSFTLFALGLIGLAVLRRSLISILISLEVLLLSVNINFVAFSLYLDDAIGQLFAIFVLTIAGAESSIGLALLVVYHRLVGVISTVNLCNLKG